MKRLTAARPVLYMGRMFQAGDALPAQDGRMVTAWLEAGSAKWSGEDAAPAAPPENQTGANTGEGGQNGAGSAQDDQKGQGGQDHANGEKNAQEGAGAAAEAETVTGNLDAKQLARMTKAELLALAGDMGVDVSNAKNNEERAALIAAVEVKAPADAAGGAQ